MILKRVFMIAALAVFFASCSNDDDQRDVDDFPLGAYDNGVLILNQGNFVKIILQFLIYQMTFLLFKKALFLQLIPLKSLVIQLRI
jgi:hypothetical protein